MNEGPRTVEADALRDFTREVLMRADMPPDDAETPNASDVGSPKPMAATPEMPDV